MREYQFYRHLKALRHANRSSANIHNINLINLNPYIFPIRRKEYTERKKKRKDWEFNGFTVCRLNEHQSVLKVVVYRN